MNIRNHKRSQTPVTSEVRRQTKDLTPDETDRKNIIEFMKTYNMTFPYPHPESLQAAIMEGRAETIRDMSGIRTSKNSAGTQKVLCLPQPFVIGIKRAYPYLFSSRPQLDWFLKNFPAFNLRVQK